MFGVCAVLAKLHRRIEAQRKLQIMFQAFEGTPNYPELERSILKLWEENQTFDALRNRPPTASAGTFRTAHHG
jgi:hypothetical protein